MWVSSTKFCKVRISCCTAYSMSCLEEILRDALKLSTLVLMSMKDMILLHVHYQYNSNLPYSRHQTGYLRSQKVTDLHWIHVCHAYCITSKFCWRKFSFALFPTEYIWSEQSPVIGWFILVLEDTNFTTEKKIWIKKWEG